MGRIRRRKAGLRLDTKEGTFAESKGGDRAVVPGKPDESDLVFRIESDDPELHMPPRKNGKPLSADQVAMIRRWVEQEASWTEHWAFKPPKRPTCWPSRTPDGRSTRSTGSSSRGSKPRDSRPSRRPSKTVLIRRVTLDLTGLPPTLAGSRRVPQRPVPDGLRDGRRSAAGLAPIRRAPGEVLARRRPIRRHPRTPPGQLPRDVALSRLGHPGLQSQHALRPVRHRATCRRPASGPDPRPDRRHRIQPVHVSTNEGGSIQEEVYVRNVVDRVDTNGTVFMGLSSGCARCHDHKFDPIRAKDYYRSSRSSTPSTARPGRQFGQSPPVVPVPTSAQRKTLAALDGEIASLRKEIAAEADRAAAAYDPRTDSAAAGNPCGPTSSGSTTPCRRLARPRRP